MKKWLIALVMVAALLAGCGSSSGDEDNSSASLGGVSSSLSSGGELSSGTLETAGSTSAPAPVAPDLSAPVDSTQDGISPDTPVSSDGQEMPQQPETPVQSTSSSQGAGTAPAQPQGAQPEQTSQPEEQPEAQPEQPEEPAQQPAQEPVQQPEASQPTKEDPPAQAQTPVQSSGVYVGSIDSDKYHVPGCRFAKKILPENEIWFDSADDARNAGYSPCGVCHPSR